VITAAAGVAAAAISVSPVRVRLSANASRTLTIRNGGNAPAAVDARLAGFVLDRRGKPVIAPRRAAAGWLRVQPQRILLAPGSAAALTVSSVVPGASGPGDHPALVLLTTHIGRAAPIAIRVRVGVVVFVRVPGRIVHRLELRALRARGRALEAVIANRGNVVERARVRISLWRRGRLLARLGPIVRTLLPHSSGIERFRYHGRLQGWVTARVEAGALRRSFRLQV
jgi:hypothetical protein